MLPDRLFLLLALAAACSKTPAFPADIQTRAALSRASSCDALTQSIQDTAVRQMRSQMDQWKDGLAGGGIATAAGGVPLPAASPGAAPASYSTTNTQVEGVDEADFVKNDGTRILVLSGHTLFTAKSWPPQDLAVAGKLDVEGWPLSMFLDGGQAVIFSVIWAQTSQDSTASICLANLLPCPMGGASTTKITVVDVSDLAAPSVKSETYLPGSSAGARRVGSSVRLVLSDSIRWPAGVVWMPPYDPALYRDPSKLAAAIGALEDKNEAVIRATAVAKWFPPGERKLQDGTVIDIPYSCTDFYLSNAPERLGLVTVATLDLAHLDAGVSRASIVGEPGTLYATRDHLYLASQHWWWWPMAGQRDYTYIHEFDIGDPAAAAYLGSGGVEGYVADSFAMDEQGGYLRVATTTTRYEADPNNPHWFRNLSSTRLTVLAPDGSGSLKMVGEVAPIVDGERLMAARFVGDKGYAVTFRNVDPLVTLDLADPAHPRKVAELTLTGFSSYLQPIDDTHLLAIGQELPLDSTGRPDFSRRAVELSLFDVSDLANPVRTAQVLVGTASAYSEALWDHHAFNWYRPDPAQPGLLAIPFSDWVQPAAAQPWWDNFVSDVRVFSVDPAGKIAPAGSLGMSDAYIQQGTGNWTWFYRPWVRRSVMATDQAGNSFVYAISDAGIRVAPLSTLGSPLGTALFPR
ncbi:MAG TPA: beta-propeller domain-containing protein [Myxococcales bacterium]|nr:beta-propeller domain-containing protein [Myxococcales bacterium]